MATSTKRKFDSRDFSYIAENISDELSRRRADRKDTEKQWDEIDRQVAMKPDVSYKKDARGAPVLDRQWMAETEMPFQAQTLEVLVADAKRMIFPDSGPWFSAHALLSDEYLRRVDFEAIVAGDEAEVPSRINQDNADKLVYGWLEHIHQQYDLRETVNRINAEAFRYGVGVGRLRPATKEVVIETARGTQRLKQKFPVFFPRSIKDIYLDDTSQRAMNEGLVVGPAVINTWTQKLADIQLASSKGSHDPEAETGGWMPDRLKGVEGNSKGEVTVIEYEGDMIVPRTTVRNVFIPNVIVTCVEGMKDSKTISTVVRLRFRKFPFSSYILFPYHFEDAYNPYAASPLVKGRPLQLGCSQAFNRYLDSAALKNEPPVGYDRSDIAFEAAGGPMIVPGAKWKTTSDVRVHADIGDPAAMLNGFMAMKQMYDDLTGVNAPRLGAQTVSHTTAFAKQQELARGTVRTVDYVSDTLAGPMTRLLYMEYEMSRTMMGEATFYIAPYRGFVTIDSKKLPDMATFEAFGAGGPAEEREKKAMKMAALTQAIQIDILRQQSGLPANMDTTEIQKQILTEGGWADVDPFFNRPPPAISGGASQQPAVAGNSPIPPGPATAALQGIANESGS